MSNFRRAGICFGAAAAALALAAAGLWPGEPRREAVILRDVSASVRGAGGEDLARRCAEKLRADDLREIFFADRPADTPEAAGNRHTATARALKAALETPPAGKGRFRRRIVLLTDGRDTGGDPAKEAAAARAASREPAAVEIVPLSWTPNPDAQARELVLPPEAAAGQSFTAAAVVSAFPAGKVKAEITAEDGTVLAEKEISAAPEGTAAEFTLAATRPGVSVFRLRVRRPDDQVLENDVTESALIVRAPPGLLWLGSPVSLPGLRLQCARAEEVTPKLLEKFPTVVINDLPASTFPPGAAEALRRHTENGGTLVVVGGKNFAAGDWENSPLAELLPVAAAPRDSLAAVFALDVSGSMNEDADGRPKIARAAAALRETLEQLADYDYAGVVTFARTARAALPLQKAPEAARKAAALDFAPAGGTSVFAGTEAALAQLAGTPAKRKIIIMLTDGDTGETPEETAEKTEKTRAALHDSGTMLTVIATGDAPNMEMLTKLTAGLGSATRLEGGFAALPTILRKELRAARAEKTRAAAAVNRRQRNEFTAPLPDGGKVREYPATGETNPRNLGEIWLAAPNGDALLAAGRRGGGRCFFWAGEPAEWDFAGQDGRRFFMDFLTRLQHTRTAKLRVDRQGNALTLSGGEAVARIVSRQPETATREIELFPRWPGEYTRTFRLDAPGVYQIHCGADSRPLVIRDDAEYRAFGTDGTGLRALARAVDGQIASGPEALADWDSVPVGGNDPRTPGVAAFVLAMLLLAAGLVFLGQTRD